MCTYVYVSVMNSSQEPASRPVYTQTRGVPRAAPPAPAQRRLWGGRRAQFVTARPNRTRDHTGPHLTAPDRIGPHRTASHRAGPDRTTHGPHLTAPDRIGPHTDRADPTAAQAGDGAWEAQVLGGGRREGNGLWVAERRQCETCQLLIF